MHRLSIVRNETSTLQPEPARATSSFLASFDTLTGASHNAHLQGEKQKKKRRFISIKGERAWGKSQAGDACYC